MVRSVLAVCVGLALGSPVSQAADPTPGELLRDIAQVRAEAAEVLASVKDETSATAARSKLDELEKKYRALKTTLETLAKSYRDALDTVERTKPDPAAKLPKAESAALAQANKSLATEHDRLFPKEKPLFPDLYKGLGGTKLLEAVEEHRDALAADAARGLASLCRQYMFRNGGNPPDHLKELTVRMPQGRWPLAVEESALLDPWGKPYRYEVGVDEQNNPVVFVWTIGRYSGKKLGNPPPEKK